MTTGRRIITVLVGLLLLCEFAVGIFNLAALDGLRSVTLQDWITAMPILVLLLGSAILVFRGWLTVACAAVAMLIVAHSFVVVVPRRDNASAADFSRVRDFLK